jgi:hypothetical protein
MMLPKEFNKPNHIFALDLRTLFEKGAKPFFASVTRDQEGHYTALKGGLIEQNGTTIEGIDLYLAVQWVGSNKPAFDLKLKQHFEAGGILAFTTGGADVKDAVGASLQMASESGKPVMFLHNDTVHVAKPNAQRTVSSKLPGFYKA